MMIFVLLIKTFVPIARNEHSKYLKATPESKFLLFLNRAQNVLIQRSKSDIGHRLFSFVV